MQTCLFGSSVRNVLILIAKRLKDHSNCIMFVFLSFVKYNYHLGHESIDIQWSECMR